MRRWPDAFEVETDDGVAEVAVRRSQRARRMRLRATDHGIELVVPPRGTIRVARRFLESSRGWLGEQVVRYCSIQNNFDPFQVFYRGVLYKISVNMEWQKRVSFDPHLGEVIVKAGDIDVAREEIAKQLRKESKPLFQERIDAYSRVMGVFPKRLRIGDQRTRWGSCSARGTISLNWRLIMAPPEVLDYIVVHELAHLREMNHSSRFWSVVEEHCPDYRVQEAWLKQYGFILMHRSHAVM